MNIYLYYILATEYFRDKSSHRPALREKFRWYRWFFDMPSPADYLYHSHYYDRETYKIMLSRHETAEPWPRIRHDTWVFPQ